ncbi:MAG: hypothetical protein M1834_004447 [Cirrosporium novae-zelandiae]|nr:MAG: hypothetical protein M1834_004447 [Cirrosporium novae-zelandiae]
MHPASWKTTLLSTLGLSTLMVPLASLVAHAEGASHALQNILLNTHGSEGYGYPTDFTQGIMPVPIHSHNDYWRPVPFYTALSVGCASVEADVWLFNGTLYVGHEESALSADRTLQSLYINPILDTLRRENPTTPFVDGGGTRNGVFDTVSQQTLYLLIDVKTDGPTTWPSVVRALEPLRTLSYLTTYNASLPSPVTNGPITIIGTGNTPLSQIAPLKIRDYFFDAPLAELENEEYKNLTGVVAPMASTNFMEVFGWVRGAMNETQIKVLGEQVKVARERGIMARYWNTPWWPKGTRNSVWRTLWEAGVGLLSVDEVEEAVRMDWWE